MAHIPVVWEHIVDKLWRIPCPWGWIYADRKLRAMVFVPRRDRPELPHSNNMHVKVA